MFTLCPALAQRAEAMQRLRRCLPAAAVALGTWLATGLGAWLAARLSQPVVKFSTQLPRLWANRFGTGQARRWALGLAGGIMVGFGARLADGCTSGHGLSGGLQLAVSGWIFLAAMMISGIIAGRLVFRRV